MIASGNKERFPISNQCASDFREEIWGFSAHVSDRQGFAGGGKSQPDGGRRNVDRGLGQGKLIPPETSASLTPDTPGTVQPLLVNCRTTAIASDTQTFKLSLSLEQPPTSSQSCWPKVAWPNHQVDGLFPTCAERRYRDPFCCLTSAGYFHHSPKRR